MNIIAITQKGPNKKENEDRIIVGKNVMTEGTFQCSFSNGVVAIADGVGGNNGGAVASQFVAKKLTKLNNISKKDLLHINEELLLFSQTSLDYGNMATTLSGVYYCRDSFQLFSIGNTRVYFVQGKQYLKQVTTDDTTINYLLSTRQITVEEAKSFERKNEITACFGGGSSNLFRIKCDTYEKIPAHFLITSDGIHDYISIDQMENIISENGLTMDACEKMVSESRNAGSLDDISIVVGEI